MRIDPSSRANHANGLTPKPASKEGKQVGKAAEAGGTHSAPVHSSVAPERSALAGACHAVAVCHLVRCSEPEQSLAGYREFRLDSQNLGLER